MRSRQFIISLLLLAALGSCGSPIDIDTKRIDTRLTNYLKLQEMTASALIRDNGDSVTIGDWNYTVATGSFHVDTSASPPRIWMNYRLVAAPGSDSGRTRVQELRLRIDDMRSDTTSTISTNPDNGTGASSRFVSHGVEYSTPTSNTASVALHYLSGINPSITGTVVLGVRMNDSLSFLAVLNFTATRDN